MKQCLRCKETKPCTAFYKDKVKSDGLNTYCKACTNAPIYTAVPEYKVCSRCGNARLWSEFSFYRNRPDNLSAHCKPCVRDKAKAFYSGHPYKKRAFRVRNQYGISFVQWLVIWDRQQGRCAVCLRQFNGYEAAQTDHCHTTGVVRGLLCESCNLGIGHLQDDPIILDRAKTYILQDKEVETDGRN